MKQNKSNLIIFLSLILSCFFLSGDVFAYKQSDLNKFENTRKCIKCDLTDLNLSRVNLSRVNLSGSNLSGSDLSGSDLSESNLSRVNLSGVNLNGSNLKDVNLTYSNLSEIIIDEKAFSTLDVSEHTFMNKSTLAEETKKKKEQSLRKKKEQSLRKKKEQSLRKKKEQALRKKMEDGYKDIKFNMDGETAFIILKSKCSFAYKDMFEDYGKISGSQCYKIMGEKRSIELKFRHDCFNYNDPCLEKEPSDILMIEVSFSMIKENSLKTLLNSLNQKYKLYKQVKIGKAFYKVFAEGNVVTKRVTRDIGTFLYLQFINPTFVSKYLEKLGFSGLNSDDI